MAVKLLVNGFFRSGTTIIWKILKKSNPNALVLYEPCHELIVHHLEEYQRKPFVDETHGMDIWEDYTKAPGLIDKIRQTHPNLGKGRLLPESADDLLRYVTIFDQLDKDIVLQTNRWSFHLKEITESSGCKTIQVVRNPIDVYRSIMGIYFKQGAAPKRAIKNLLKPLFINKAFGLGPMYKHTWNKFGGASHGWEPPSKTAINMRPFNTFLITWTMANYSALKATQGAGGTFVSYETVMNNPDELKTITNESTGLEFNHVGILTEPKRRLFITDAERCVLVAKAEQLNINEEFNCILKKLA